jgi:iron-sulfur cluster assembly protein
LRLDTLKATAIGEAPRLGVCLADEPEEDDQPVEREGEPLLWISIAVSAGFDGFVMDLVETPEVTAFAIGPPEAGREARS